MNWERGIKRVVWVVSIIMLLCSCEDRYVSIVKHSTGFATDELTWGELVRNGKYFRGTSWFTYIDATGRRIVGVNANAPVAGYFHLEWEIENDKPQKNKMWIDPSKTSSRPGLEEIRNGYRYLSRVCTELGVKPWKTVEQLNKVIKEFNAKEGK